MIPGDWRDDPSSSMWVDFSPTCSNNFSNEAKAIREKFKSYFSNEGAVPWQWRKWGID